MKNHSKKKKNIKKIKTFQRWETNLSAGNKTEPKHRLYKRKIRRPEMESKEHISKDIKQKPQIPLWYPKKWKYIASLDHWGWKKPRKTKLGKGSKMTSFHLNSPQRMLGRNLFWLLLLFFYISFFNRHELIARFEYLLAETNALEEDGILQSSKQAEDKNSDSH